MSTAAERLLALMETMPYDVPASHTCWRCTKAPRHTPSGLCQPCRNYLADPEAPEPVAPEPSAITRGWGPWPHPSELNDQ